MPKAKVYFSCVYLGELSKTIVNDLQRMMSHFYPQVKLQIVFKSHSTIGGHFSFKDRQPQLCKSNLIYKYTCERCKAFYIGKTEQQLAARISKHSGISARTGKQLRSKPQSDVYDHCQKCHVPVLSENFTIIDTLPSEKGLLILESLHQQTKKPQIGIHQRSTPIMSFDWLNTYLAREILRSQDAVVSSHVSCILNFMFLGIYVMCEVHQCKFMMMTYR